MALGTFGRLLGMLLQYEDTILLWDTICERCWGFICRRTLGLAEGGGLRGMKYMASCP